MASTAVIAPPVATAAVLTRESSAPSPSSLLATSAGSSSHSSPSGNAEPELASSSSEDDVHSESGDEHTEELREKDALVKPISEPPHIQVSLSPSISAQSTPIAVPSTVLSSMTSQPHHLPPQPVHRLSLPMPRGQTLENVSAMRAILEGQSRCVTVERELLLETVAELRRLNDQASSPFDVAYAARWLAKFDWEYVLQVVSLMSTTKGVDKVAKLCQFVSRIFKLICRQSSTLISIAPAFAESISERASNLESEMSRVRKSMRLLKVLKEVLYLRRSLTSGWPLDAAGWIIEVGQTLSAFAFYWFDHVMWAVDVHLIRPSSATRNRLNDLKNLSSVGRLFFQMSYIINAPHSLREQERELWTELEQVVKGTHPSLSDVRSASPNALALDSAGAWRGLPTPVVSALPDGLSWSSMSPRARFLTSSSFGASAAFSDRQREVIARIARDLRLVRAKKYNLLLDMLEFYTNFILLGDALRWINIPPLAVAICGVVNGVIGIYKLWMIVFSNIANVRTSPPPPSAASPSPVPNATPESAACAPSSDYSSAISSSPRLAASPSPRGCTCTVESLCPAHADQAWLQQPVPCVTSSSSESLFSGDHVGAPVSSMLKPSSHLPLDPDQDAPGGPADSSAAFIRRQQLTLTGGRSPMMLPQSVPSVRPSSLSPIPASPRSPQPARSPVPPGSIPVSTNEAIVDVEYDDSGSDMGSDNETNAFEGLTSSISLSNLPSVLPRERPVHFRVEPSANANPVPEPAVPSDPLAEPPGQARVSSIFSSGPTAEQEAAGPTVDGASESNGSNGPKPRRKLARRDTFHFIRAMADNKDKLVVRN